MLTVANAALHGLHLAVITFSCVGWIWDATRPLHLALAALIAASWFVLGPLIGDPGHCALTGLQHRIWSRLGRDEQPNYMSYLAQRVTGRKPNERRVGQVTQLTFYGTTLLSIALQVAR